MTPERWQEIQQHLEALLELEPAFQGARIRELASADADLAAELASLLTAQSVDAEFLDTPALRALWEQRAEADNLVGHRLGRYRIEQLLGVGGMGEVYRARRDDEQYKQQVAIKFVRSGTSGPILTRFRNERQILAGLEHPNIARLLDGGTADDGSPYLVMELIEGQPIDAYCDGRHLSIADRLSLFLQVCAAVEHAHRRLIVHRDLKPSNILVTGDGTPKLLDFGIAKILTPDPGGDSGATRAFVRLMTPGYASPEQLTGAPVTTASDVYSLGVVLYELLTGHHPLGPGGRTRTSNVAATRDSVPERPSAVVWKRESVQIEPCVEITPESVSAARGCSAVKLARRLKGDLDDIVLLALRFEPERRYASVQQFADDIRGHLADRPVIAHRGALRYRAAKFLSRHKPGVAAAALVALTLLAGVSAVLQQDRVVRAEKLRADRRFNDVRRLAHALLFEDHDAIQSLPGSTPARKLIVSQSLDYLRRLSGEAADDPGLQRELADAYERVARIQGSPLESNLGDAKGALDSFSQSLAINQTLATARPGDVENQLALARVSREIGSVRVRLFGDISGGTDNLRRSLAIASRLQATTPQDPRVVSELAFDHRELGLALGGGNAMASGSGDIDAARREDSQAVEYFQQATRLVPGDRTLLRNLLSTESRLGDDLIQAGERPEARQHFEAADRLLVSLLERDPHNVDLEALHSVLSTRVGEVLCMDGQYREALGYFRNSLAVSEAMTASDPQNQRARILLADALLGIGYALSHEGQTAVGLGYFNRVRAVLDQGTVQSPGVVTQSIKAMTYVFAGDVYRGKHQPDLALRHYERARAICEPIAAATANDSTHRLMLAEIHNAIGAAHLESGRVDLARQQYLQALQLSAPIAARLSSNLEAKYSLVNTNAGLGDVSSALARRLSRANARRHWQEACSLYAKSLTIFDSIKEPAYASPGYFAAANRGRLQRRLHECQAAVGP